MLEMAIAVQSLYAPPEKDTGYFRVSHNRVGSKVGPFVFVVAPNPPVGFGPGRAAVHTSILYSYSCSGRPHTARARIGPIRIRRASRQGSHPALSLAFAKRCDGTLSCGPADLATKNWLDCLTD